MTMLPPICVNAWLSQSSRNGRLRKTSRTLASSGVVGSRGIQDARAGPRQRHVGHAGWGPTAALRAGSPRLTKLGEAALEGGALEQQVAAAGLAAEPDVGAEAVDQPRVAAARMGAAEAQDVAQVQLDGGA